MLFLFSLENFTIIFLVQELQYVRYLHLLKVGNNLMSKFLFNKKTLYISLALVPLSFFIGWGVVKKWNHDFTLLGPYGDFFAGTTVPILTFISFLSVIMTLNQQQEQLDIQKNEIEANKKSQRLEDLRRIIINVDESLDLINFNIDKLDELIKTSQRTQLNIFNVDNNYNFTKSDLLLTIVETDIKQIRNGLIRTNIEIYENFLNFNNKIKTVYSTNILSVESGFETFERELRRNFPTTEFNPNFATNFFNQKQKDQLESLSSELQAKEMPYIKEIRQCYVEIKYLLDSNMAYLIEELKKN